MRRPTFVRWAKREALLAANAKAFGFKRLAGLLQDGFENVKAPLFLYAYETDDLTRLRRYILDASLLDELKRVENVMGERSVEKLALRGTPMRLLPPEYQACLDAFARAYRTPERLEAEKRVLWEQTTHEQKRKGIPNSTVYQRLGLNPGNVNAYLKDGAVEKLSLENARILLEFVMDY